MDKQVSVKITIQVGRSEESHATYQKEFSGRLLEQGSASFIVHPNEETTSEGSCVTHHDALRNFMELNSPHPVIL